MADTLLFRGGPTSNINDSGTDIAAREIVIDTDTDEIVVGGNKKRTLMQDSSGTVKIIGSANGGTVSDPNIELSSNGSAVFKGSINSQSSTTSSWFKTGTALFSSNYVWAAKDSGSGVWHSGLKTNSDLHLGSNLSSPNIQLNGSSGSASFAGSIQSGGNPDDGGANGFKVSNGKLTTTRASTADSILCYSQGTSTPTVTIKANGSATFAGSVSIGGTANANTIDEYEEGTWTPAWNFAGGGSIPVIVNEAKYTKIGDTVTLICNITNGSGASSPTGDVTITGLPYSCSGQSAGSIALMRNWNTNFDGNLSVAATGNTLSFRKNASNVTDANLNATDFNLTQFSCVIYITVTYRVS